MKFSATITPFSLALIASLAAACTGDVLGSDRETDAGLDPDAAPTDPMGGPDAAPGPTHPPGPPNPPPPPPPPARKILFVVGQDNLGPSDKAAEERMESLGFEVVLRTGPVVKAADATGRDLVVISSSTLSTDVGTRLRDVDVPVIVWEPALFDDMAMTGATEDKDFGTKDDQTKIVVKLPNHPIASAAGISAGAIQVVSTKDRFSWGQPLPSADVVATLDGFETHCGCDHDVRAAIFAYDKGDAIAGGRRAKHRRLGIFLNNDTTTRFNPAGWAIFDSAIRWAAGAPACTPLRWFADVDTDGFGDDATQTFSCTRPTTGGIDWVNLNGDCNDVDDAIHPGAPEVCDGVDQDCNALVDEQPVDGFEYYTDGDGDGFGNAGRPVLSCSTMPPAHTVVNDDDCDDSSAAIRPGVPEIPGNAIDENCDGLAP